MSSTSAPSLSSTLTYVQQELIRYVESSYLIFGVTGCCLNILLFSRAQFRTSSCCRYLQAMSVAMVLHLSWGIGIYLYALNHVDPNTTILAVCKLRVYILQASSMMYRWCLVAACFDRYTLSAADARWRNFAKIQIARRVIPGIVIVWMILPVHLLIFYNLRGSTCGIVYSSIAALYHSIFTIITGGILPITIMLVCALLIHRNLRLKRRRRQQLNTVNQPSTTRVKTNDSQSRRDQQVLFMLLVQVLIYGILAMPLMIWYFYIAITLSLPNKSPDRLAIEHFIMFMAELIIFGFPTCTFYLYTMASRMFRAELVTMLHDLISCQWSKNGNRIDPVPNANQMQTVTAQVTQPAQMPPSYYLNREKSADITNENEQTKD